MPRFRNVSLLWKILFSTSIAITALFGALGWLVQNHVVRIATVSVEEEARSSFRAYESLWRARADQLASVSLVLSRMPDVRAAVSTQDKATIRDIAHEIWDNIPSRGAVLIVADPRGVVIATTGNWPGTSAELAMVPAARARFPKQASGFVVEQGRLYQVVLTPVYVAAGSQSGLINVLAAAVPVDAHLAAEMKEATGGSEFVFVAGDREVASTLPSPEGDWARFTTPLLDIAGRPIGELRILRSFEGARRRLSTLRQTMLLLWVATMLAGIAVTYVLARRLLRPIRHLDSAASEIAAGNYEVQVPVRQNDEIGRLAQTFNSMSASIRSARNELIRQERLSTISRLSTTIVHDLRNPLASIYGGSELLMDGNLPPGQVERLAANIYRASSRIRELLQELTDARQGRAQGREMCRICDVIEAACEAAGKAARDQGTEIVVDVPSHLDAPLARSPMERVFQNLIANALEALQSGGRIMISVRQAGAALLISVDDTGPGIPDTIASRLFEPFVTAGKKNGMGLGLALSRETVREHGGDLWVETGRPAGARFVVRLPLVGEPAN